MQKVWKLFLPIIGLNLLIFFTSISCATIATTTDQFPKWIEDVSTECSSTYEMCAVGEGVGMLMAEANARKSLAMEFEVKVTGKNLFQKNTTQNSTGDTILEGEVQEQSHQVVEEFFDEVLKAVKVKKRVNLKDKFFVLVSLDRKEAAKRIASEMKLHDDSMQSHFNNPKYFNFKGLLKQFAIREKLNLRYEYLHGQKVKFKLSYDEIYKKKLANEKDTRPVWLEFIGNGDPGGMIAIVSKELVDNGFKVVTQKKPEYRFHVLVNLKQTEDFIKVEGFVRYNYQLEVLCLNRQGQRVGSIGQTVPVVGRNIDHTFQRAMDEFKVYVVENFHDLNLAD